MPSAPDPPGSRPGVAQSCAFRVWAGMTGFATFDWVCSVSSHRDPRKQSLSISTDSAVWSACGTALTEELTCP